MRIKIGILHRSDISNIRMLSGTPHYMAKALEKHVGDIVYLGPDNSFLTKAIEFSGKLLNWLSYALLRKRISSDHHRFLSRRLAHTLGPRVRRSGCDVLFCHVASIEIAYLDIDLPIVYSTDLNWFDILDYYPTCSRMFGFARNEGNHIEQRAIEKAHAVLYPSSWAAKTAVEHYGAAPHKIRVIPYGANLESTAIPSADAALAHSLADGPVLLWIGVDWERKGGPIAYDCLVTLLDRGINVRLIVCGCQPPDRYLHKHMQTIPYLNKLEPTESKQLSGIFLEANIFLFPTQAEALGIVIAEASAHGLPSLVRDTGGVRGVLLENENGCLMPPDASGKEYANLIMQLMGEPVAYSRLVQSCRDTYDKSLNWDAWAQSAKPIFDQLVKS